jgi:hypothetical protein
MLFRPLVAFAVFHNPDCIIEHREISFIADQRYDDIFVFLYFGNRVGSSWIGLKLKHPENDGTGAANSIVV